MDLTRKEHGGYVNILVTGSGGRIGTFLCKDLIARGHRVVGYDLKDGDDIVDAEKLKRKINGIEAIIHLAVYSGDEMTYSYNVMNANLQGLWNLLTLAAKGNVEKIVFMSSVDALGVFKGEAVPDYFPIDDEHPCRPSSEYGISKKLSEEMCKYWSSTEGIPVVCLQPPGVWFKETYVEITEKRNYDSEYEWKPYWEYGAFVDVRDLSDLCCTIIETSNSKGFTRYLVSSDDITTSGLTSREWVKRLHPDVSWKRDREFEDNPYRSLLDNGPVKRAYNWKPRYSWNSFVLGKQ